MQTPDSRQSTGEISYCFGSAKFGQTMDLKETEGDEVEISYQCRANLVGKLVIEGKTKSVVKN